MAGRVMRVVNFKPKPSQQNDATTLPNCPAGTAKGTSGSPDQYRAMWQNVENRFKADGVDNVVYVMTYISYPRWDCAIKDFWPGNDLVDWVAWDPYALNNTSLAVQPPAGHFAKCTRVRRPDG